MRMRLFDNEFFDNESQTLEASGLAGVEASGLSPQAAKELGNVLQDERARQLLDAAGHRQLQQQGLSAI